MSNIDNFDPNGIGHPNGKFIGLPFEEADAKMIIQPVTWDATVSFHDGTSTAWENILEASYQLDLYDDWVKDAWKMGLYLRTDASLTEQNMLAREKAKQCISMLEQGVNVSGKALFEKLQTAVNAACGKMNDWVYNQCQEVLGQGKILALLGGDHSTPLGYLRTLSERYDSFSILQIDAHMDLRKAYEGFTYSHASIFYNALELKSIQNIVQVGIRDCCDFEVELANESSRVVPFFDHSIKAQLYQGLAFVGVCNNIVENLDKNVYLSFDIDGLDPKYCPNTGTPVPGGLSFTEALFLIKTVVDSGRKIIGFDLSETAGKGNSWDGNVAARLLYSICNLTGKSNQLI